MVDAAELQAVPSVYKAPSLILSRAYDSLAEFMKPSMSKAGAGGWEFEVILICTGVQGQSEL